MKVLCSKSESRSKAPDYMLLVYCVALVQQDII